MARTARLKIECRPAFESSAWKAFGPDDWWSLWRIRCMPMQTMLWANFLATFTAIVDYITE